MGRPQRISEFGSLPRDPDRDAACARCHKITSVSPAGFEDAPDPTRTHVSGETSTENANPKPPTSVLVGRTVANVANPDGERVARLLALVENAVRNCDLDRALESLGELRSRLHVRTRLVAVGSATKER